MKTLRRGFTLVEMLIVIVIIGILAAALIPRLNGAQAQARDTARLADLNQLGTALAVYQGNNGDYPSPVGFYVVSLDLQMLVDDKYIKSLPSDPQPTRTTTFCEDPLETIDGYFFTASLPGSYGYMPLEGGKNFVLSANVEVKKKGNRIPSTEIGFLGNGTGCISDWDVGETNTLTEVNANIVKGSTIPNSVVDTIYIYAN